MEFNVEKARKKVGVELNKEEFEANMNEVFAQLSLCAKKEEKPCFTVVGGQPGSGKSTLIAKEHQNGGECGAIIIDQDELRTKFPKYSQIQDNYSEREEFLILKPYVSKAIETLIDKAAQDGYNIIIESGLRSISTVIKIAEGLKEKGYTTRLSVLVVPEVEANISMLMRYCQFVERFGECRRCTTVDHSVAESVRTNIERLDKLAIFDDITMSIRGENIEDLPVQKYSKKRYPEIMPVQAYDEWRTRSLEGTKRNFIIRYKQIKAKLIELEEYEQLSKLESIKATFEELVMEKE